MTSLRRWLWLAAPILVLSCIGALTLRNVHRRAERTRRAFAEPATPGSLKEQLIARGCVHVAVLPMLDFEELQHTPLVGTRAEALLAVCEARTFTDCDAFTDGLRVGSPTEVLVRAPPHGARCQARVDARGKITDMPFLTPGMFVLHRPPPRPWYVYPLALAHRGWQHVAYR